MTLKKLCCHAVLAFRDHFQITCSLIYQQYISHKISTFDTLKNRCAAAYYAYYILRKDKIPDLLRVVTPFLGLEWDTEGIIIILTIKTKISVNFVKIELIVQALLCLILT